MLRLSPCIMLWAVSGADLELTGSQSAVLFGSQNRARLSATCENAMPTTVAFSPTNVSVEAAMSNASTVRAWVHGLPPCYHVSDLKTPCVPYEDLPPLFYCRYTSEASANSLTLGPVTATAKVMRVSDDAPPPSSTLLPAFVDCPLPLASYDQFAQLALADPTVHEGLVHNLSLSIVYYEPAGTDSVVLPFAGARGGDALRFTDFLPLTSPSPPVPSAPPASPPPPPASPPPPPVIPPALWAFDFDDPDDPTRNGGSLGTMTRGSYAHVSSEAAIGPGAMDLCSLGGCDGVQGTWFDTSEGSAQTLRTFSLCFFVKTRNWGSVLHPYYVDFRDTGDAWTDCTGGYWHTAGDATSTTQTTVSAGIKRAKLRAPSPPSADAAASNSALAVRHVCHRHSGEVHAR